MFLNSPINIIHSSFTHSCTHSHTHSPIHACTLSLMHAFFQCLGFHPNGCYLASGGTDGTVRMWDVNADGRLEEWMVDEMMDG